MHQLTDEHRQFYNAYQRANKCAHQYIDDLHQVPEWCTKAFEQYRKLFDAGQQRGKCRNTDDLVSWLSYWALSLTSGLRNARNANDVCILFLTQMWKLDTKFDSSPSVSYHHMADNQNNHNKKFTSAGIFLIFFGGIITLILLAALCDFIHMYQKNKALTINYRPEQRIVWRISSSYFVPDLGAILFSIIAKILISFNHSFIRLHFIHSFFVLTLQQRLGGLFLVI